MKKLLTLLTLTLFTAFSFASEHVNLRDEMMVMAQRLTFATKSENIETFQSNITAFIDAAKKSQSTMPTKWQGDQSQFPDYQQGLQKVIDLATESEVLAKAGKLDEAKEKLNDMPELRRMYHKLYK